jgi:hypothetical protein
MGFRFRRSGTSVLIWLALLALALIAITIWV